MKYYHAFRSLFFAVFLGWITASATGCRPAADSPVDAPPPDLSSFIEEGLQEWDIPGMAVAIVHQDEVVFTGGYGVRRKGEPDPVDENTLFGVASITKAITAAALGILVDEGKIGWDDSIVDYLPDFELYDPWVTEQITIRDALTHRSGLGRMIGNRLQFMTDRDRSELIYRLRYLEPEIPFRSGYVYNNMMYMVAGEIIPAVTGQSWDDFVTERIFTPLGMDRSNTSVTQIADDENAAWPHQEIDGELVTIPRRNFDNAGPAASVNASVTDMAQWMRLHLGEPGLVDGQRLVSKEVMHDLHSSQVLLPERELFDDLRGYALGWFVQYHRGHRIQRHGGGTDGMNTTIMLMPERDLGLVIVANTFTTFRDAIAFRILDHYLGVSDTDWNRQLRQEYEEEYERQMARRDTIHQMRQAHVPPSLPAGRFTGRYYDDLYAELEVLEEDGRLVLRFWEDDTLTADLEHWEGDRYRAVWRNPAQREKFVEFVLGPRAVVEGIDVTFNLRPEMLQVGAYPSDYTRTVRYRRVH
ncbi:MAG: serine hydrolase [Balneolaceae bacterium]|nr:MAG: serine hydrolase [Balneolaceae bacterium]